MPRNFNTVCWAIINTLLSPKQKKETLVVWTSLNTQVLALNVCVCGGVCAWACLSSKNYYFSVYYNINHIGHTDLSRIDFAFVICWLLLRCACHWTWIENVLVHCHVDLNFALLFSNKESNINTVPKHTSSHLSWRVLHHGHFIICNLWFICTFLTYGGCSKGNRAMHILVQK